MAVVDAGPLYAVTDTDDDDHVRCRQRLDTDLVVTLDRRHFEAVKPKHCRRFELLPAVA